MKHAFLIISHHEFEILSILVNLLDDPRNDIFIHFDKKLGNLPELSCKKSNLYFVDSDHRIDVRWGDITQIKAEFSLFELANLTDSYAYYHLISGVHLPLVKQDVFHEYFNSLPVSQVFSPMPSSPEELERKGNMMNFFMKSFNLNKLSQVAWRVGIKVQELMGIKINKDRTFIKASNWVSITQDAVEFLLSKKKNIINRYKYSMCGDELFIPTEFTYSGKNWNVMYSERMLLHKVGDANSTIFGDEDSNDVLSSNFLFARKFSSSQFGIVEKIIERVKQ